MVSQSKESGIFYFYIEMQQTMLSPGLNLLDIPYI